jgi:hypothetical protein
MRSVEQDKDVDEALGEEIWGATRPEGLRPEWFAAELAETRVVRDVSADLPAVDEVEKSAALVVVEIAASRDATTESRLGVPSMFGGGPHL